MGEPVPQRIQLRRTKGWRMPANTVRVCRPGKWGNPYKAGRFQIEGPYARTIEITPADAVRFYRSDLLCPDGAAMRAQARRELRGKNLACFCRPGEPCHADVLLEIANAQHGQGDCS